MRANDAIVYIALGIALLAFVFSLISVDLEDVQLVAAEDSGNNETLYIANECEDPTCDTLYEVAET